MKNRKDSVIVAVAKFDGEGWLMHFIALAIISAYMMSNFPAFFRVMGQVYYFDNAL